MTPKWKLIQANKDWYVFERVNSRGGISLESHAIPRDKFWGHGR